MKRFTLYILFVTILNILSRLPTHAHPGHLGPPVPEALLCAVDWPVVWQAPQRLVLSDNRACLRCWALPCQQSDLWLLLNTSGAQSLVAQQELLGVDEHPLLRRLWWMHHEGIGLPGTILD